MAVQPGNHTPPSLRAALVTCAVAALAFGVALLVRGAGGLIAFGALFALLVLRRNPFVVAGLQPLVHLVDAGRPLAVPLVVLALAGVLGSALAVQVACGLVATLVVWRWLIAPEALTAVCRVTGRGVLVLLAVPTITAVVLASGNVFEERGGLSTFLFEAAVLLLVVAFLSRLAGYATSVLRLLVALAVVAAGARLAVDAGLIAGYPWVWAHLRCLTATHLLEIAAGAVAAAVIIQIAVFARADVVASGTRGPGAADIAFLRLAGPVVRRRLTGAAAAYGFVASLLAALALALGVVAATNTGGREQIDRVTLEPVRPAPEGPVPDDDRALAEAYAPVLTFTEDQRFSPVTVDTFVRNATMTDWEGRTTRPRTVAGLGNDCPGIVSAPCYQLASDCGDKRDGCATGVPATLGERRHDGAIYVRVARADRPAHDGSPNPFDRVGPYANQVTVLLQYWFFYAYNDWVAPVLAGELTERHQADWEALTIGLGAHGPLFVAYSEHCGGEWFPWPKIHVVDEIRPRLHPLVAVAEGSQANYRDPDASRAPDWGGCARIPEDSLRLASYASNIRDRTGTAWSWTPGELKLVRADDPPMSFLGRWAPASEIVLDNARPDRVLGRSAGPASPTLQPLWREPMRTIFARHGRWHGHPR